MIEIASNADWSKPASDHTLDSATYCTKDLVNND